MSESIKYNAEKIAEISKRIASDMNIDINTIKCSDDINKIVSEAVKEFDELQRELERSGL